MIRDHSRIILIPNLGHLPILTYRDRAPGLLALPGAFAPGPKLPALSCQVSYSRHGGPLSHVHIIVRS